MNMKLECLLSYFFLNLFSGSRYGRPSLLRPSLGPNTVSASLSVSPAVVTTHHTTVTHSSPWRPAGFGGGYSVTRPYR